MMVSLKAVPAVWLPGFDSAKVLAAAGETVKLPEVAGVATPLTPVGVAVKV